MFHDWDGFYLLVGSGAGALIGIMFLIATLTAGFDLQAAMRGARVFLTPVVFHFSAILVVSVLTAVPGLEPEEFGVAIAVLAAAGFLYSAITTARMFAKDWPTTPAPDLEDKFFYGFVPTLLYAALGAGAAAVWLAPLSACYIIGAAMLGLLLNGIRNTWDLATYIVQRGQAAPRDKGAPGDNARR